MAENMKTRNKKVITPTTEGFHSMLMRNHHHLHCRGWNADNEKNLIEALASSLNKQEVGGSFLPIFRSLHFYFTISGYFLVIVSTLRF